ncbi:hypothetical protein SCHPADRAFT_909714 [Schizopora paradoxa]|uniref:Uncharacterized protein n=1 Tax=Schizopora paradoxa TaxID=27342 RepID=A0A0H2R756_9AGAM|nr:hypothetical protein SCHPADRAFT_909714 [Schizopora paradoxa]
MVLTKFVRGEIFSKPNPDLDSGARLGFDKGLSNAILQDLLSTRNRDAATLFEYGRLEIYLEKTEDSVYDVLRHACDEKLSHPDSSKSDKLCEMANELGDFMHSISDVIREMIVLRREGVETLSKAAAAGKLRTLEELV